MKNSEINKPVSFDPKNFSMSKAAVNHFKQSLSSMNSNLGIRFSVVETSVCSGYTYVLDFVKKKQEEDKVFDCDNVKVLIDPKAIMELLGTEMHYKKEELSSTFVFKNPNETERCGCGESFKI